VSKADPRVEAYGSVDELNAQLGVVAALPRAQEVRAELQAIQSDLFTLGAALATDPAGRKKQASRPAPIDPERVAVLEGWIDRWEKEIKPLRNFILPGGDPAAAALHVARAVCRRAERAVVRLSAAGTVDPQAIVYLNRLSDLLFVLARRINARAGTDEPIWKSPD
jgi:cob(I)alamin adenosyltransferase